MSRKSGGGISLSKFSFYLAAITAIMYLVSWVLSYLGIHAGIVGWIRAVAGALMAAIVLILAWRYVAPRETVWKVLYFIVLLLLLVFIILPAIL